TDAHHGNIQVFWSKNALFSFDEIESEKALLSIRKTEKSVSCHGKRGLALRKMPNRESKGKGSPRVKACFEVRLGMFRNTKDA
ncbi:MAG: hypothetical protein Q3X12_08170, partial [Hallella sp.]|nr:hypothetical protein [Hallella sp.]